MAARALDGKIWGNSSTQPNSADADVEPHEPPPAPTAEPISPGLPSLTYHYCMTMFCPASMHACLTSARRTRGGRGGFRCGRRDRHVAQRPSWCDTNLAQLQSTHVETFVSLSRKVTHNQRYTWISFPSPPPPTVADGTPEFLAKPTTPEPEKQKSDKGGVAASKAIAPGRKTNEADAQSRPGRTKPAIPRLPNRPPETVGSAKERIRGGRA